MFFYVLHVFGQIKHFWKFSFFFWECDMQLITLLALCHMTSCDVNRWGHDNTWHHGMFCRYQSCTQHVQYVGRATSVLHHMTSRCDTMMSHDIVTCFAGTGSIHRMGTGVTSLYGNMTWCHMTSRWGIMTSHDIMACFVGIGATHKMGLGLPVRDITWRHVAARCDVMTLHEILAYVISGTGVTHRTVVGVIADLTVSRMT